MLKAKWLSPALLFICWPLLSNTIEIQTDRYTVVKLLPTESQLDPLAAVVQVRFPGQILNTEQAIHYVLDESGYELVSSDVWTPEMKIMLSNVLPVVQRDLSDTPMTVVNVLEVLAGQAFRVVRDPLRRKVSFELNPEYRGLIDG